LARTYTLKKRAEQQAQTRQRIVEAAIDLHGTVGPANTTFSMIAERAGVQRHTLYAHFPDERSLLQACSGLHGERHPMPDAAAWRDIPDPRQRLTASLDAMMRSWHGSLTHSAPTRPTSPTSLTRFPNSSPTSARCR
jgi:AcrR family transcriptional regulator